MILWVILLVVAMILLLSVIGYFWFRTSETACSIDDVDVESENTPINNNNNITNNNTAINSRSSFTGHSPSSHYPDIHKPPPAPPIIAAPATITSSEESLSESIVEFPTMYAKCGNGNFCGGDLVCDVSSRRCKRTKGSDCASNVDCESNLRCVNWVCVAPNTPVFPTASTAQPTKSKKGKSVRWGPNSVTDIDTLDRSIK
jgi:hypothetical protein